MPFPKIRGERRTSNVFAGLLRDKSLRPEPSTYTVGISRISFTSDLWLSCNASDLVQVWDPVVR